MLELQDIKLEEDIGMEGLRILKTRLQPEFMLKNTKQKD